MTEFDAADLPDVARWRSSYTPPPDAPAFLVEHMSIAAATLFAEVMAPDLVLVDGCVLVASRYRPESLAQWRQSESGDVVAIEGAINRLHLWDMFDPQNELEERALEHVADLIASSWEARAQRLFPGRDFVADVTDEYGPTVVLRSRIGS